MSQLVNKMNPDIKALWVEELRKPETKQGFGVLKSPEGMCCLGVLTDLFLKSDANVNKEEWTLGVRAYHSFALGRMADLPTEVADWAGIVIKDSYKVEFQGDLVSLVRINDKFKLPFTQIADIIEEQM